MTSASISRSTSSCSRRCWCVLINMSFILGGLPAAVFASLAGLRPPLCGQAPERPPQRRGAPPRREALGAQGSRLHDRARSEGAGQRRAAHGRLGSPARWCAVARRDATKTSIGFSASRHAPKIGSATCCTSFASCGHTRIPEQWTWRRSPPQPPRRSARSSRRSRATLQIGALPTIWGQRGKLEQVFVNLLTNAVRHLPDARRANRAHRDGRKRDDHALRGGQRTRNSARMAAAHLRSLRLCPWIDRRRWKRRRSRHRATSRRGTWGSGLGRIGAGGRKPVFRAPPGRTCRRVDSTVPPARSDAGACGPQR